MPVTDELPRRVRVREAVGSAIQYTLLFGFAAVAAAISAHGLVGFARVNMALPGPWPYLLWGALDGAAGLCAVLLVRRAARGESALAPRLAVWGLVAASSWFNWTHAPRHPGAPQAFALMPVIAAILFEFSLRETRRTARRAERRITGLTWLRPCERIRVQLQLAADPSLAAADATRRVRIEAAARRLHALRLTLANRETARPRTGNAWRMPWAERRARAALTRARFADPGAATEVLRHVQVLTLTPALAKLDYSSPAQVHGLLASLLTNLPPDGAATPHQLNAQPYPAAFISPNGHSRQPVSAATPTFPGPANGATRKATCPVTSALPPGGRKPGSTEQELIAAAARIVADAQKEGELLSQAVLARRLRSQGFRIANERLRWLATASGLESSPGPA